MSSHNIAIFSIVNRQIIVQNRAIIVSFLYCLLVIVETMALTDANNRLSNRYIDTSIPIHFLFNMRSMHAYQFISLKPLIQIIVFLWKMSLNKNL